MVREGLCWGEGGADQDEGSEESKASGLESGLVQVQGLGASPGTRYLLDTRHWTRLATRCAMGWLLADGFLGNLANLRVSAPGGEAF